MKSLRFALFTAGLAGMLSQLMLLREFYSVLQGNELVFGIVLGNWLLLTGVGSLLGRHLKKKNAFKRFITLQAGFALMLPVVAYLVKTIPDYSTVYGEAIGVITAFKSSLLLLAPLCIPLGILITLGFSLLAKTEGEKNFGVVYYLNSFGDIFGGILFSFLFVYILDAFQVVFLASSISLVSASYMASKQYKKVSSILLLLIVLLILLFSAVDLTGITNSIQYRNQRVLYQKNSLYGNIVVTELAGQLNFFEDGVPLFSTENTASNEESVHYALCQRDARNVLLISGGVSGILNEILKYGSNVDYAELDPVLLTVGVRFMPESGLSNPRVSVLESDGRMYVKQSENKYDVILVNVPSPNTVQLNRFYTAEFFREVKDTMSEDGVLSISLASSENYLSPEDRRLHGVMYDTLKGEFKNVLVVPGERVYYVASDGPLSYDIAGKLNERRIETKYVNANYLKGVLTEERIRNFIDSIQNTGEINSDFKPVVYSNYLERTARQFNLDLRWLYLLLAVIMLVVYMNLDSIQLSIFNFGFSGVVLEVAVLVFFQIIYGFVYGKIGLLVTFFMAGLALGAYHTTHKHASIHADKNLLEKTVGGMTACSILIPVFSYVLSETASSLAANVVFPLFTLVVGLLVGAAFPLACRLYKSKDASTLYALDLFGAFTGSVAASALLIPALGVVGTCILAGLLNALILAKLKLNKGI